MAVRMRNQWRDIHGRTDEMPNEIVSRNHRQSKGNTGDHKGMDQMTTSNALGGGRSRIGTDGSRHRIHRGRHGMNSRSLGRRRLAGKLITEIVSSKDETYTCAKTN